MTFLGLTPLVFALVAGGAAALLAVLHFLRVRPQEVPVPTLLFWRQAVEETRARTLFKRFRHPRTWLFLSALAAALALALAEPETEDTLASIRHEVLVLDTSDSMAAPSTVAGKSRLDVSRDEARAYAEGLPLRDRCALAVSWCLGTAITGFDTPRPVLVEQIGEDVEVAARADLEGSLDLARSLVRGRTNPRILVWTDRDDLVPEAEDVTTIVRRIGGPASDAAITGIAFTDRLWVEIASGGDAPPREVVVSEARGGPVLARAPVTFDGAHRAWFPIDVLGPETRLVTVTLEPGDAVGENDRVRGLVLPRREITRVFVDDALPAPVRALVASDPTLSLVPTRDEAAVVFAAGPEGEAAPGDAPIAFSPVSLLRETAAPLRFPILSPGTKTLAPIDEESVAVLRIGNAVLARMIGEGPRRVEIAPGLLAPGSNWLRDPVAAGAVLRTLREAGEVIAGALVVPGGEAIEVPVCWAPRVQGPKGFLSAHHGEPYPGIVGRALGMAPVQFGARSDLGSKALETVVSAPAQSRPNPGTPPPEPGRGGFRIWEGLAALVLALGILDAVLHARGRIP